MDFDFNYKWGVGHDAEMLNVSLFGSEKKRKKRQSLLFSQKNSQNLSAVIQDSDDEKYSKKGKKKLKERKRKQRKKEANENNEADESVSVADNKDNSQGKSLGQEQGKDRTENLKETPKKKRERKRKKQDKHEDLATKDDGPNESKKRKTMPNEAKISPEKNLTKKHKLSDTVTINDNEFETANGLKDSKKKKKQKRKKYREDKEDPEQVGTPEVAESQAPSNSYKHEKEEDVGNSGQLNGSTKKNKQKKKKQKLNGSAEESNPPSVLELPEIDKAVSPEEKREKKKQKKKGKNAVQTVPDGAEKQKVEAKTEPAGQRNKANPNQKLDKNTLKRLFAKADPEITDAKNKSKKKRESEEKNKSEQKDLKHEDMTAPSKSDSPAASIWGSSSGLVQQARETLNAARFRYLNEQLYTCTGQEAKGLFQQDRESFKVYHEGYQGQVAKWEVNPLNTIIKQIKDKPKSLVIADLGCGEGLLGQSVPQKVHSFDLVALNPNVTACNMAKVPLPSESVDIVVFCLSLMGTNLNDYLIEANRILKPNGLLKVAEVVSRFSGVSTFMTGVCAHGFTMLNKRDLSQMFYLMDFRKVKSIKKSTAVKNIVLKPCIYKKR